MTPKEITILILFLFSVLFAFISFAKYVEITQTKQKINNQYFLFCTITIVIQISMILILILWK